jgi:hypothetical protein
MAITRLNNNSITSVTTLPSGIDVRKVHYNLASLPSGIPTKVVQVQQTKLQVHLTQVLNFFTLDVNITPKIYLMVNLAGIRMSKTHTGFNYIDKLIAEDIQN